MNTTPNIIPLIEHSGYAQAIGSEGADVFVIDSADKYFDNVISDFQDGLDKIDISALSITSFDQLSGITAYALQYDVLLESGLDAEAGTAVNYVILDSPTGVKTELYLLEDDKKGVQWFLDPTDFIFANEIEVTKEEVAIGTDGADVFVVPSEIEDPNTSAFYIDGFENGVDKIDVSGFALDGFEDLLNLEAFVSFGDFTIRGDFVQEEGTTFNRLHVVLETQILTSLYVFSDDTVGPEIFLDESDFIFV